MAVVPAAEVLENFGRYCEAALVEPLIVTDRARLSVVITSIEEYERLRGLDRRAMRLDEMTDARIEEVVAAEIPPELAYSSDDIPGWA